MIDIGKLMAVASDMGPIIDDVETFLQSPEGQSMLTAIETELSKLIQQPPANS